MLGSWRKECGDGASLVFGSDGDGDVEDGLSMPGCRKVHSVRWLARVGIMLVMYASPRSCGVGTGVFDLRGSRERE